MWLNQSFLIDHPLDNQLDEKFVSLRDGKPMRLQVKSSGEVPPSSLYLFACFPRSLISRCCCCCCFNMD